MMTGEKITRSLLYVHRKNDWLSENVRPLVQLVRLTQYRKKEANDSMADVETPASHLVKGKLSDGNTSLCSIALRL